jgi:hypothetical protein
MTDVEAKMTELIQPIDKQIYMCNDTNELLMLNCVMLQRVREIFDLVVGEEGRKKFFSNLK